MYGRERQRNQQVKQRDANDVRPDDAALVVDEFGGGSGCSRPSDWIASPGPVGRGNRAMRAGRPRRARLGLGLGGLEYGRHLLDRFYRPPSITSLNRSI